MTGMAGCCARAASGEHAAAPPSNVRNYTKYSRSLVKCVATKSGAVQQPTKFPLIVNLAAARALGIELPTSLLLSADEVQATLMDARAARVTAGRPYIGEWSFMMPTKMRPTPQHSPNAEIVGPLEETMDLSSWRSAASVRRVRRSKANDHSYRSASIGSRCAALRAG